MGLKRILGKFYTFQTRVVVGSQADLEKLGNDINNSKTEDIAFIVPLGIMPNGDIAIWLQTKKEVQ